MIAYLLFNFLILSNKASLLVLIFTCFREIYFKDFLLEKSVIISDIGLLI